MLRAWFKHGLVRVIAFLIVGFAVVVSTQLLRGQDSDLFSGKIKHFIRSTLLSWVDEPAVDEAPQASLQVPSADPEGNGVATEVVNQTSKTTAFSADQHINPTIEVPAYCAKSEVSSGSIVMGDRVQLRFFAAVPIPADDSVSFSSTSQIGSVAYERLDLSGSYDIGEDGTAALPLVGRIELVGRSLACAEAIVAREMTAQDGSVSSVTASFAQRLPVTISGAVRAPGSYNHSPGMTVNRLLNLAGASFGEGIVTPQEFESLIAQRAELLHRQILAAVELGRVNANIAGTDEIIVADDLGAKVAASVLAPLLATETTALAQDLSVSRISDARSAVAIAGFEQKSEDMRSQLATVDTQLASLQLRYDEMTSFKTRGLIQASQMDVLLSNLMELDRIKKQLETDQSNLASQIDLAKEDARLAIEVRRQDFAQRGTALSGQISLLEVQISAIASRLAGHGIGAEGEDFILPLHVSVLRTGINGTNRLNATLDTVILPGDMVTISMSATLSQEQITAENGKLGDAGATASGSIQP